MTLKRLLKAWDEGVISKAELSSRIYDLVEALLNAVPGGVRDYVLRYLIDLLIARCDGVPHIMVGSNLKE